MLGKICKFILLKRPKTLLSGKHPQNSEVTDDKYFSGTGHVNFL